MPNLASFRHVEIGPLAELASPRFRNEPYLLLQTNEGRRLVYNAGIVPSQYVRRIITAELGMPGRWHWQRVLGAGRTAANLCGPLALGEFPCSQAVKVLKNRVKPRTAGRCPGSPCKFARCLRHGAKPDGGL